MGIQARVISVRLLGKRSQKTYRTVPYSRVGPARADTARIGKRHAARRAFEGHDSPVPDRSILHTSTGIGSVRGTD